MKEKCETCYKCHSGFYSKLIQYSKTPLKQPSMGSELSGCLSEVAAQVKQPDYMSYINGRQILWLFT